MRRSRLSVAVFYVVSFTLVAGSIQAVSPDFFAEPPNSRVLDTESRLALGFLTEAQKHFGTGDLVAAASWADRGLQLDPGCSDLLLLRSRIQWRQGLPAWSAIESARSALKSQRWLSGRYADAFLQLLDLLLASHDYRQALREYDSRFSERDILKDPRLAAGKLVALYRIGEREAAGKLAANAVAVWPDDPDLAAVRMEFAGVPAATDHRWFDRFRSTQDGYRRALFWYIQSLPSGKERLTRCEEYVAMGGPDRMVFPWALESALLDVASDRAQLERAWLDRFLVTAGYLDLSAAAAMAGLLQDPGNQQKFRDTINSASSRAYRDFDHDGQPDETMELSRGQPVSWTADPNQDRLAELRLDWQDGWIVRASQLARDRTVVMTYDRYPEVASVSVSDVTGTWGLTIPHRRLEMQFIELPPGQMATIIDWLPSLDLRGMDIILDPAQLARSAEAKTRFRVDSKGSPVIFETTRLVDGLPVASRDDSDGDGVFDHLVWYEAGIPVLGFRDIENTGEFNAVEVYRDGRPSEVQYSDSRQAYRYRLDLSRGFAQWDLNADGIIDVREMRSANQGFVQEFSRNRDGLFDIRAVDGKIRAVLQPVWMD